MTPAWARELAGDHDPSLAFRAVRLAAAGWADPARLAKAIRTLLEGGLDPGASEVFEALERTANSQNPLPSSDAVDRAGRRLADLRATVCFPGFPGYPARLAQAWPELGAPAWLFVTSGGRPLPDAPAVAVVGTRHPSLDGLDTARELGRTLAARGVVVISGMARGIDQAAHQGALDVAGATVAVLGTGFGVDYPRGDHALRDDVARAGGLVTELPPGEPPRPRHFLGRNRIISGLADATVVVEGRTRSGALQTARMAAGQGREVLAVPGSLNAPTSRAPLALIRDGARCITHMEDVLEAINLPTRHDRPGRGNSAQPTGHDRPGRGNSAQPTLPIDVEGPAAVVLRQLGTVPATPGRLAAELGLPVGQVLAAIGELTDRGMARATPRGVIAG